MWNQKEMSRSRSRSGNKLNSNAKGDSGALSRLVDKTIHLLLLCIF